jgi:hypothetical protein
MANLHSLSIQHFNVGFPCHNDFSAVKGNLARSKTLFTGLHGQFTLFVYSAF